MATGIIKSMRKKTKPTSWDALTAFTVNLDDLHELLATVREVSTSVDIETDVYTDVKTVDELAAQTRQVKALTITGSKAGQPQIIVKMEPRSASVWVASDSASLIGALEKVKRTFWRHASPFPPAKLWPIAFILGTFFGLVGLAYGMNALAGLFFVPTAVLVVLANRGVEHFTRITLVREGDAPGFWQRQSENIVLSVVIGLGTGVVLLVLDRLTLPH